jgi:3-phenylpropionate/trans-cinnamate dioxygenase ferredoxin component
MALVRVISLEELGDGEVTGVNAGGKAICIARIGAEVYAFADNCSHRDFPLSNGELDADDCSITCEWHGARFDVRTGKALSLPATRPIPVYEALVEDGMVFVDVP